MQSAHACIMEKCHEMLADPGRNQTLGPRGNMDAALGSLRSSEIIDPRGPFSRISSRNGSVSGPSLSSPLSLCHVHWGVVLNMPGTYGVVHPDQDVREPR